MKNLMIVDMQKGLIDEDNKDIIDKINSHLKDEKYDNVIYTRFYNHEESPFALWKEWKEMSTEGEIEFAVDMVENSFIFPKCSYGLQPEQVRYLKGLDIEEIVLCGYDIEGCILAIAFNLFDNGIRPRFKLDLCVCSNKDREIKQRTEALLLKNFGKDCIIY